MYGQWTLIVMFVIVVVNLGESSGILNSSRITILSLVFSAISCILALFWGSAVPAILWDVLFAWSSFNLIFFHNSVSFEDEDEESSSSEEEEVEVEEPQLTIYPKRKPFRRLTAPVPVLVATEQVMCVRCGWINQSTRNICEACGANPRIK